MSEFNFIILESLHILSDLFFTHSNISFQTLGTVYPNDS